MAHKNFQDMRELNRFTNRILFCCLGILIGCSNTEDKDNIAKKSGADKDYIKFYSALEDTLSKHLLLLPDSCSWLIQFDKSYVHGIYRLNAIPFLNTSYYTKELDFTIINDQKVFVSYGIEMLLLNHVERNIINCGQDYFVLYDSLKNITVINEMNDYDNDFNPD